VVTMDHTTAAKLREPFKPEEIGKLPRIWCAACRNAQFKVCDRHRQLRCDGCGNKITDAHLHLDYVGHAEITDRLLQVDPNWSWEPVAFTPDGVPFLDVNGGLWIRLTVAGVVRLGYGDAEGKRGANAVKEAIGDALRNAAMRFGVGLDLWGATFERQAAEAEEPASSATTGPQGPQADLVTEFTEAIAAASDKEGLAGIWRQLVEADGAGRITTGAADQLKAAWRDRKDVLFPPGPSEKQTARMFALLGKAEITDRDERLSWYSQIVGRDISTTKELTGAEVDAITAKTEAWIEQSHPQAVAA